MDWKQRKTKLILMPSKQESWGRVATEAHCSGIPVIASDVEGLPESVGEGGITISLDAGIEKWQESLDYILNDDVYDDYVNRSLLFSQRDEINSEILVNKFVNHIREQIGMHKE